MTLILKANGFILKHLLIVHHGGLIAKIKSTVYLALASSPVAYILEKLLSWSMANQEYLVFVLLAIMVDHILGSIIHGFILRDFSFRKNLSGLILKIGLTVVIGLLFEGVNHIMKGDNFIKDYLTMVLRLSVFLYPAGSAFMNSAIITKGKFPPIGWMEKIKKFNQDLDLKQFKEEVNHIPNNDNQNEAI